ncbi:splicing factor Cactin-like isoform X1 [Oncorhynchus clarkii lewisi]|uniref:splicing factor Cactin-like isoform X1 n=1 Tax=Oncorhynchus clarkii lewisi TaxID=490388 RepID=UPI0039B90B3C
MGPKKHRRSRSGSRSRNRDRNRSKISRSRSPEEKRDRSRSIDRNIKPRRIARSESGNSNSSGGSTRRQGQRPRSRDHPGSRSDSDSDKRRKLKGKSKDRSRSDSDDPKGRKKREKKKSRREDKGEKMIGRSQSQSDSGSSADRKRSRDRGNNDRERRWRRSADRGSRSPSRERERQMRERTRDRERMRSRDKEPSRCKEKSRERSSRRSEDRGRREGSRGKDQRDKERNRRRSGSSDSSKSSGSDGGARGGSPGSGEAGPSVRDEKKNQREMLKALETPEEKRARRLAKKEAKERKKREKMGWSEEYMGYTNADNPFGDNNLLGTFKWQKALDRKGIGHLGEKDLKDRNKRIQEENRRELQKVKQLRLEREREKAMRETELEMLQREKEAEHFKTWAEQEDNFHLHQAKLRSKIRIRDGRAKPIDLLAKYISAEDDDLAVEMHEPYTFLNGLTVTDMDDLLEDIKVYMELEQGKNVDFWRDMTTITEDEISKLRKLEASGKGPGDRRDGINTSVSTDVQIVFKGKTYSQLQALNLNIETKIRAGGSNLDIGYWESLMQQVRVFMGRARLRERHQDVLRQKLFKLKQEQGVESEPLFPIIKEEPEDEAVTESEKDTPSGVPGPSSSSPSINQKRDAEEKDEQVAGPSTEGDGEKEGDGEEKGEVVEAVLTEEDLIQQSQAEYDSGRYSPTLLLPSELPLDTHTITPDEDTHKLHLSRRQLAVTGDANENAEDEFVRRAKQGMGGDEAQFSVELPLTGKMYLWADKYRPRKPRFFNRVHTGFEWNKYNQTHYDFDNPPPKIVQGYKFNIFYPDLINKRSTPQYFLEPSPDNKDFGVLRFHAGPPYEDIAFKIVNREWEYSHRHGFRCQFANGIFQLWFHFKRYRYRR